MAEPDKLNIDSIIQRLLEGKPESNPSIDALTGLLRYVFMFPLLLPDGRPSPAALPSSRQLL